MTRSTTEHQEPLEAKITNVSSDLHDAIAAIVGRLAGPTQRPASLARTLKIDKSLSGRILRTVKATDPFETIHNTPAPYGLRLFIEAADREGVERELCDKAQSAVSSFESLIASFPDGRTALEAAISDHMPEVQARNERAARQAAYKSMSYLLGYQCDGSFVTSIITPSEDETKLDFMHIGGLHHLRRLRGRAPMILFGIRRYSTSPDEPTWIESIDGERDIKDATRYLLSDFCAQPLPDFAIHEEGDLTYLALRASSLPINTPVDLVNGWISRKGSLRYRSEDRTHEWHSGLARTPTKVRVQDYFIHKDVLPDTPEIWTRLHGLVASHVHPQNDEWSIDQLDLSVSLESLGRGLSAKAVRNPATPGYDKLLNQIFDRSNLYPDDFRVYRCSVVYPVPFVALTAWFELPEAPKQ